MKIVAIIKSRPLKDKTYKIVIRISSGTNGERRRFINTPFSVIKRDWNPKSHIVRESSSEAEFINDWLAEKIKELKVLNRQLTLEDEPQKIIVKAPGIAKISEGNSDSFLVYLNKHIKRLKASNKFNTAKVFKIIENHLIEQYLPSRNEKDLLFEDINADFINDFIAYFYGQGKRNNTIRKYLKTVKSLYNKALAEGLYLNKTNPFLGIKLPKNPVKIERLTIEQIIAIIDLKFSREEWKIELARDMFIFAIFSHGMRVSDVLRLTWANIKPTTIKYRMFKTEKEMTVNITNIVADIVLKYIPANVYKNLEKEFIGKIFSLALKWNEVEAFDENTPNFYGTARLSELVPLLPSEIMNDFVFPVSTKVKNLKDLNPEEIYRLMDSLSAIYNKNLKVIGAKAGIPSIITTHIARHSFADIARQNDKVGIYSISKMLGHSDLNTTELYLKSLDEADQRDASINFAKGFEKARTNKAKKDKKRFKH